jgi:hypothetical protein
MTLYPNLRPWIPHPEATLIILHGAIDVATFQLYWQAYRPRRGIDRDIAMFEIDKNETAQDLHFRATMILQEALTGGEVKATGRLAGGLSSPIEADDWVRLSKASMWGDEFTFEDGRRVSDVLICTADLRLLLAKLLERLTGARNSTPQAAKTPRLKRDEVERQYRASMASLPPGTTGLREIGQKFLRELGVPGNVRNMEIEFRSRLPKKPKRGRPVRGLGNSAK